MKSGIGASEDFFTRFSEIVGAFVVEAKIGVGTMLTIDLARSRNEPKIDHIWIYLANWALLHRDAELLAADMSDEDFRQARNALADIAGRMVLRVHWLSETEVHIDFSGQFRLEVWPDHEAYGRSQKLVLLFSKGKHVTTLVG